jgi:ribosomal protein S4E
MSKSNVAEKTNTAAAVATEVKSAETVQSPVMTVVKNEPEEPRKLTLDERIQRVEDLSMLIDRWRQLTESRRKLQTFQIGSDSLSSVIMLKDASGNEFKTSNSAVITSVIDEMKRTLDVKVREVEEQINL